MAVGGHSALAFILATVYVQLSNKVSEVDMGSLEGETAGVVATDGSAPEIKDHDCPFVAVVTKRRMGGRALLPYEVDGQDRTLAAIHADGICPPTHIDGNPTTEWADLVESLKQ